MQTPQALTIYQQRINDALTTLFATLTDIPVKLHSAMTHAVCQGGKRIRPCLVYAIGEAFAGNATALDTCAMAIELIHSYSLVHDDLPAMDDSDLRRGQPTVHKAYDEATAILVGDGLQTLAFSLLAEPAQGSLQPSQQLQLVRILAQASGVHGMVSGQAIDLASAANDHFSLADLQHMHHLKTGRLITAALQMGVIAATANNSAVYQQVTMLGDTLGLAFQIADDILDIEASTDTLGKPQGADAKNNKQTYPFFYGLAGAKQELRTLQQQAHQRLEQLAEHVAEHASLETLTALTDYIVNRCH